MSRDFTTKPRPDQPGRCPSIDPHDTLQCTRAIHDDDQCQAGGIAWRKGSPRIEWDRERADRLQEEIEEYDAILTRQSDLLTRTVNALRGNPPPLTSWSHHDIPKLAAEKVAEVARLTAECLRAQGFDVTARAEQCEWFNDRFPCDGVCVDAPEEACSRHGRNPADLWRIIGEVTAERDALAAQVARVESLAEDWERDAEDQLRNCYSGRDVFEGERTVQIVSELRDALAGSEADTSDTQTTDQEA